MKVQNHRVIILKYHLTITHGTANITYHSRSITLGRIRNYLENLLFNFRVKKTVFFDVFPM